MAVGAIFTLEGVVIRKCRCGRANEDERFRTCAKCREHHRRRYYQNRDARIAYQRDYADRHLNKHREVCPSCRQVIQKRLQREPIGASA